MKLKIASILIMAGCLIGTAQAGAYEDAISSFRHAGESSTFFRHSYAYAVFPTVGEGAIGVGGAFGKGRIYRHGRYIGDSSMGKISVGFQLGGKGYSEIIFFKDEPALAAFEESGFEFGADVGVVAITAGASATAGTAGTGAQANAGVHDAVTRGQYQHGMAVFTIAKGGLMYQAAVAGQKFNYTPK